MELNALKNYTHTEGASKASLLEKYINDWDAHDQSDTIEIFQSSIGLVEHKAPFSQEVASYKHNFASLRDIGGKNSTAANISGLTKLISKQDS